jgi:hypothetical protein
MRPHQLSRLVAAESLLGYRLLTVGRYEASTASRYVRGNA